MSPCRKSLTTRADRVSHLAEYEDETQKGELQELRHWRSLPAQLTKASICVHAPIRVRAMRIAAEQQRLQKAYEDAQNEAKRVSMDGLPFAEQSNLQTKFFAARQAITDFER